VKFLDGRRQLVDAVERRELLERPICRLANVLLLGFRMPRSI
jgi:hypothetical protein